MVGVGERSSGVVLWRSQDIPARKASVANPTASALPTGPGFMGMAWPNALKVSSRRGTRSLLLSNEAPHHPQKRFCDGCS